MHRWWVTRRGGRSQRSLSGSRPRYADYRLTYPEPRQLDLLVVFHPGASEDYAAAFAWYDARGIKIASDFESEIDRVSG